MEIDDYEKLESEDEQVHFDTTKEDTRSELKGRHFRAWNSIEYECLGHFPCGYHMRPTTPGVARRHCISERAIGRTYHETR